MKKYVTIIIILSSVLFVSGGCQMNNHTEDSAMKEKATEATIKYFQDVEGIDVEVTNVEISPSLGADAILVDAKVVGEKRYVYAIVDQHADYKISVTGESENN